MRLRYPLLVLLSLSLVVPALALANARLVSVTPVDGGCVSGPTGPTVQAWDVQPGKTYTLQITNVVECAAGGTAATLNVRVNSSNSGNTDLVATFVSPGVYQFNYTMPANAVCTFPVFYCTTPGAGNSGLFVYRNDGVTYQAHLRAATFGPGCTTPTAIIGGDCLVVPNRNPTWSAVKAIYR